MCLFQDEKKMIRYRDNKIVSTKGERFTQVSKQESEEMKKSIVNMHPSLNWRLLTSRSTFEQVTIALEEQIFFISFHFFCILKTFFIPFCHFFLHFDCGIDIESFS